MSWVIVVAKRKEVIEVGELALAFGLFVLAVDVGNEAEAAAGPPLGCCGRLGVGLGCDQPGLEPADLVVDVVARA